jgi:uncharacterized protein YyaL (SSP411 family)
MNSNRLAKESSPYLLQHAHNPVDWFPWGEEAFAKAKSEDKPILVSIGYAACHWCHVMERESFEDSAVAAFMNAHFVNIKVDREERPDVDHIYMDAVQAMTGSGGWPLNAFLLPDGRPFYGGTYFPPRRAFNRASWQEVLTAVANAYREKKDDITRQAETLTEHLQTASRSGTLDESSINKETVLNGFDAVMKTADKEWGGFGNAPKFPQTFAISFLLRFGFLTGNEHAKSQALFSLDKMICGGIYDQLGGGSARYSTDREWLAPHFEKMLYDNALLLVVLSEAFQFTGNKIYCDTIAETIDFLKRELMHPEGGFYSALDADSEGVEGKFYVWDHEEVKEILGEDAGIFTAYFDIKPVGNWEETSIPRILKPAPEFSMEMGISEAELAALIERGKKKLMEVRAKRIRPGLDDKILIGWNALMAKALCQCYAATGEAEWLALAGKNLGFLLEKFSAGDKGLYHTWKEVAKIPAFLDDYSYVIAAILEYSRVSFDYQWLGKARELAAFVIAHFSDEEGVFFYYTPDFQTDILVRKKELYDGATPSGNSIMARNLYELSLLLDLADWRERAAAMVGSMGALAGKYPTSFGCWLSLLMEMTAGTNEVAVVGPDAENSGREMLKTYLPHTVLMVTATENDQFPLLRGKKSNEQTLFFLCRNYECQAPVFSRSALLSAINANNSYRMQ